MTQPLGSRAVRRAAIGAGQLHLKERCGKLSDDRRILRGASVPVVDLNKT